MRIKEILEAFNVGAMPEISHTDYQASYAPLIARSELVAQVRANLSLYRYMDRIFLLVKDGKEVLGNLNVSKIDIAGKGYFHVDGIFVDPEYRKTAATYWLIYAVKEALKEPVVADGAIFADGQELIRSLLRHQYLNVGKINLHTGEITELGDTAINSTSYAYVFSSANLGFGKKMFEGTDLPYVWYPLFEEIT